ncbi:MAG: YbaN family protein [Gammaproteobacteria bacterium]|nr:YbaN family protein [Gammaproteobacteria bacterium]
MLIRHSYFLLGWLFFALGIVGVALPAIPTTPFMLLALWAFSRSSQRFHDWLYNHTFFGPPLQQWQQYRVVPFGIKLVAISFMLMSMVFLLVLSPLPDWVTIVTGMVMSATAIFLLSKPSYPPVSHDDEASR